MRPLLHSFLLGTTVAALLAGCTSTIGGQATPKVDNPLNTKKFEENPCLALTADQSEGISRPDGECTVVVGTKDPCEVAADIASETVKTMSAG